MKKNICFLLQSNVAGGAERVMISLANELSKNNFQISIIIFDKESSFYAIDKNINIIRITNKEKFKKLKNIEKRIIDVNPDCVISFLPIMNYIGIYICKKNNIPIIISERNDPTKYSLKNKILMKLFYRKADGIVCQSNYVKNICQKKYKNKNIIVIANPITNEQVGKYIKNKSKKVISVGRLVEQKNHKLLITAFSKLSSKYDDYKLYIYGEGPLKNSLNCLIEELGMKEKIFLKPNESEVIKNNRDASLFVLSSNFEGYPNVLVEAMANGIPSISSDFLTGSAREIIEEEKNGFLFEVGNEKELISKIEKALDNKEKLNNISLLSTKIYNNNKIEIVCKIWINFIYKII